MSHWLPEMTGDILKYCMIGRKDIQIDLLACLVIGIDRLTIVRGGTHSQVFN